MKYYIGLDVHSKETSYCLQDETGKVIGQGKITSTHKSFEELKKRYEIPDHTMVGLESGTQAVWTVGVLHEIGLNPVVINAFEVRRKARRQRQKTDSRDAYEICEGIRRGIYDSIVYIPEEGVIRLRRILSRRRHYVKISTMEINAAKYVLREAGLGSKYRSLKTVKAWQKLLANPLLSDDICDDIRRHFEIWQHAQKLISEYNAELKKAIEVYGYKEIIDRLMTMPGVGPIVACSFFSTVGDVKRFRDSNHLVSYLGLAPSMQDSGGKEKHGGITRCGSKSTRAMLCEAAHHAAKYHHPLRPYFGRICVKHGQRRAVVTVAHRMARILYQMWKRGEDFDASKLNVKLITKETKKEQRYVIVKSA